MKRAALRLPKLKTRDELLRTAPELGRFLAAGDEPVGTVSSLASGKRAASRLRKPRSPGIKGRAGSPQHLGRISDDEITEEDRVVRKAVRTQGGLPAAAPSTDWVSLAKVLLGLNLMEPGLVDRLMYALVSCAGQPGQPAAAAPPPPWVHSLQRAELERVKAERAALLDSLAKLRNDVGKSGGELQQEDIRLLRHELEAKQEKLNELRRATAALDAT